MLQRQSLNGAEIYSLDEIRLRKEIQEAANSIRKNHPEVTEIILYGSFAKNTYTPFSDIDMAIIVSKSKRKFIERTDEFIDFFSKIPLDVNLAVYTIEEMKRMSSSENSLIKEILKGVRF